MSRSLRHACRAVRTQRFLAAAAADLRHCDEKAATAAQAAALPIKALTKAEADAFVERLAQDAVRRDIYRRALPCGFHLIAHTS